VTIIEIIKIKLVALSYELEFVALLLLLLQKLVKKFLNHLENAKISFCLKKNLFQIFQIF